MAFLVAWPPLAPEICLLSAGEERRSGLRFGSFLYRVVDMTPSRSADGVRRQRLPFLTPCDWEGGTRSKACKSQYLHRSKQVDVHTAFIDKLCLTLFCQPLFFGSFAFWL